eukprot:m.284536 g.284536  ORF g.284536 m.284536 type:complete len:2014 (+) comp17766_c0_seq2:503-6544(+)
MIAMQKLWMLVGILAVAFKTTTAVSCYATNASAWQACLGIYDVHIVLKTSLELAMPAGVMNNVVTLTAINGSRLTWTNQTLQPSLLFINSTFTSFNLNMNGTLSAVDSSLTLRNKTTMSNDPSALYLLNLTRSFVRFDNGSLTHSRSNTSAVDLHSAHVQGTLEVKAITAIRMFEDSTLNGTYALDSSLGVSMVYYNNSLDGIYHIQSPTIGLLVSGSQNKVLTNGHGAIHAYNVQEAVLFMQGNDHQIGSRDSIGVLTARCPSSGITGVWDQSQRSVFESGLTLTSVSCPHTLTLLTIDTNVHCSVSATGAQISTVRITNAVNLVFGATFNLNTTGAGNGMLLIGSQNISISGTLEIHQAEAAVGMQNGTTGTLFTSQLSLAAFDSTTGIYITSSAFETSLEGSFDFQNVSTMIVVEGPRTKIKGAVISGNGGMGGLSLLSDCTVTASTISFEYLQTFAVFLQKVKNTTFDATLHVQHSFLGFAAEFCEHSSFKGIGGTVGNSTFVNVTRPMTVLNSSDVSIVGRFNLEQCGRGVYLSGSALTLEASIFMRQSRAPALWLEGTNHTILNPNPLGNDGIVFDIQVTASTRAVIDIGANEVAFGAPERPIQVQILSTSPGLQLDGNNASVSIDGCINTTAAVGIAISGSDHSLFASGIIFDGASGANPGAAVELRHCGRCSVTANLNISDFATGVLLADTTSSSVSGTLRVEKATADGILVARDSHGNTLGNPLSRFQMSHGYITLRIDGNNNTVWASVEARACELGLSLNGDSNVIRSQLFTIQSVPSGSDSTVSVFGSSNVFDGVSLRLTDMPSDVESVYIFGASNGFKSGSIAVEGGSTGLRVSGSGFWLKDCSVTIADATGSGIDISGSDAMLDASILVVAPGTNGIHFQSSASRARLFNNISLLRVTGMAFMVDSGSVGHTFGSLSVPLNVWIRDGTARGMYLAGSHSSLHAHVAIRNQSRSCIFVEGSNWQIDGNYSFDDTSPDRWSMVVHSSNNQLGLAAPFHLRISQNTTSARSGLTIRQANNVLGSHTHPATIVGRNLDWCLGLEGTNNSVVGHTNCSNNGLYGSGIVLFGNIMSYQGSLTTNEVQFGVLVGTVKTRCISCAFSGILNATLALDAMLVQHASDTALNVDISAFRCNRGLHDVGERTSTRGTFSVRNASIAALSLYGFDGSCLADGDSVEMQSSSDSAVVLLVIGTKYRIAHAQDTPVTFTSDASSKNAIDIRGDGTSLGGQTGAVIQVQEAQSLLKSTSVSNITVKLQTAVCSVRTALWLVDVANSTIEIANLSTTGTLESTIDSTGLSNSQVIIEGSCLLCRAGTFLRGSRNNVWVNLKGLVVQSQVLHIIGRVNHLRIGYSDDAAKIPRYPATNLLNQSSTTFKEIVIKEGAFVVQDSSLLVGSIVADGLLAVIYRSTLTSFTRVSAKEVQLSGLSMDGGESGCLAVEATSLITMADNVVCRGNDQSRGTGLSLKASQILQYASFKSRQLQVQGYLTGLALEGNWIEVQSFHLRQVGLGIDIRPNFSAPRATLGACASLNSTASIIEDADVGINITIIPTKLHSMYISTRKVGIDARACSQLVLGDKNDSSCNLTVTSAEALYQSPSTTLYSAQLVDTEPHANTTPPVLPEPRSATSSSSSQAILIGIVVTVVALALVSGLILYRRSRHRVIQPGASSQPVLDEGIQAKVEQQLSSNYPHLKDAEYKVIAATELSHPLRGLGQGAFGEVQLCQYNPVPSRGNWLAQSKRLPPTQVAVKTIKSDTSFPVSPDVLVQFLIEARVLLALQHEHVVAAIGVQDTLYPPQLVLEYCPEGELLKFLRQANANTFECDVQLAYTDMLVQVASAVAYLHAKLIIHRDLAARNVLLVRNGGDYRLCGYILKLSDLGMARMVQTNREYYKKRSEDAVPLRWQDPKAISTRKYTQASDVFSFGVVIYEVCSGGQVPYSDLSAIEVLKAVAAGRRLGRPTPNTYEAVYDLMRNCMKSNPADRPTMYEAQLKLAQLCYDKEDETEL